MRKDFLKTFDNEAQIGKAAKADILDSDVKLLRREIRNLEDKIEDKEDFIKKAFSEFKPLELTLVTVHYKELKTLKDELVLIKDFKITNYGED